MTQQNIDFSGAGEKLPAALAKVQADLAELYAGSGSLGVNALANGVTGDGVTADIAAINALLTSASASGRTVLFPDGNYICPSQILLPVAGVNVLCAPGARFIRTFRSTGASGLIAQSSYASKIANVFWQGGKLVSPSNTVDTYAGNMVGLYGDNLVFKDLVIDTFGGPTRGGRAFAINGDQIRVINPRFVNPNPATGNGGIRVTGGNGFLCIGGYVESGDVVFQFVPSITGVLPISDSNVSNGSYIGCVGYSFNASLCEVGVGNQTQEVNDGTSAHVPCLASVSDCSFVGVKGIGGNGRAVILLNTDSAGSISNIKFVDCSFSGAGSTEFAGVVAATGWQCSGGIDGVDFDGCTINDCGKTALLLDGTGNYSGTPNATLDAQSRLQNVRNVRWRGGTIAAPTDGSAFVAKLAGTRNVSFRDARLIAKTNDAIQIGAGSTAAQKCYATLISGCAIEGIADGQFGVNNQVSDRTIVENTKFTSAAGASAPGAVRNAPISGGAGAYYTLVQGCDFRDLAGSSYLSGAFNNGSTYDKCIGIADADFISGVKSGDENITSNDVLANDADLLCAVQANATYEVFLQVHWNQGASALGGLQWALTLSSATGCTFDYVAAPSATAARSNQSSTQSPNLATALNHRIANAWGVLKTGNAAITLNFARAQQSSNASALTIYEDSILRCRRMT